MDALPIRILPTTPDYVMSEPEVLAYYDLMRERAKQVKPVQRLTNEQGEEIDENGEVIRYHLDPPCYFALHYTEVANHPFHNVKDWAWPVLVAAMPALLTAGHEGKYAVVSADSIAVAEKLSDAQVECRRLGFENTRLHTIRERITFGRTYPRLRRACKPTPPLPQPGEATAKAFQDSTLAHRRRERDGVA